MQQLITLPTVMDGLHDIGVQSGCSLVVHCSLSSLGRVQGGAQTLVEALTQTVGKQGNIIMPTLTNGRFDPSEWQNPPVPEAQWQRIRFETPLFHPQKTPVDHTMSVVYELFRCWPGTVRSEHPHSSVAAWGKNADDIIHPHHLADRFGETSPLARLYDLDAQVLFIGTGYDTNTCFHLGEYRQSTPPLRQFKIVQQQGKQKRLHHYQDVDTDSSRFDAIGVDFESACHIQTGLIGQAQSRRFSLPAAVDFARDWLNAQ